MIGFGAKDLFSLSAIGGPVSQSPRQLLTKAIDAMRNALPPSTRLSLMLIDLDRFHLINELCGPAAGDMVLDIVARDRLNRIEEARIVHLSGDEFACLLPFQPGQDGSVAQARRILQIIGEPIHLGRHVIHLTASIGFALERDELVSADALLHSASIALSHAKATGGDTFRRYQREMLIDLDARAVMEDELRSGLLRGELVPFYQPIVALDSGRTLGFEALVRWKHPRDGLLSPERFLPMVEQIGIDNDLLFMMLRRACRDARAWPPHYTLSINVSPSQICDPDNAVMLLQILFACGLPPGRLIVEITEDALIDDMDRARETIQSLRNAGIRVALDDFGTGYASLARLCDLEIDHLKIDRTLVQALDREAGRKLVKAAIDLAHSLSMPATAEGIETEEQARFLRGLNCTYGQGYLFGRPAPPLTRR